MHTQKKCKFKFPLSLSAASLAWKKNYNKFFALYYCCVCLFLNTTNNFDCLKKTFFKSARRLFAEFLKNYFSSFLYVNIILIIFFILASYACDDAQLSQLFEFLMVVTKYFFMYFILRLNKNLVYLKIIMNLTSVKSAFSFFFSLS